MEKTNYIELLDYIDPASCSYQDWCAVGMALKHEGLTADVWEKWSSRDARRYHKGECQHKWNTFGGSATPVTGGTLVNMAKQGGWLPCGRESRSLDWNDSINDRDERVIVDKNRLEGREITEPKIWDPAAQLITYIETLFQPDDYVGYVTRTWERDGKAFPTDGCRDRTARQLLQQLDRCKGDIGAVLGDYNPDVGAWIRFNPLDGKGVKNENVTEYRYALVESDSVDIEKQNAIIRELELPIACLVHSGNKSLHAIVRIDALTYQEYRKRVDYLYNICRKNGLEVDTQNRNPSRLSRMPGVLRGGNKQFLIDTSIGKASWEEWVEWVEAVNDDMPDPESLGGIWDNLPELAPPLVDGVLRQGHKMLLAGPSKAGKSYALIELCIAIAEGKNWLGFDCAQGRIMYVNLEVDRASCLHRFKDVYAALGWQPENIGSIDIWNLRGKSVPMDALAPKLIRRAAKKNYMAIIIDPIYKVITGDENSADQMAKFCNQFDKVCNELGCAVIYCHHHSKGAQGGKRSMDRASGSGVFARDPDALLDLIELEVPEAVTKQEENRRTCDIAFRWLERFDKAAADSLPPDDRFSPTAMIAACRKALPERAMELMVDEINAAKKAVEARTAWRIEGTLREYPHFSPINVWFDYPTHVVDHTGILSDAQAETEQPPWMKGTANRKKSAKAKSDAQRESFIMAVESSSMNGGATVGALAEYFCDEQGNPKSRDTIYRWIKKYGYGIDKNTGIVSKLQAARPEN